MVESLKGTEERHKSLRYNEITSFMKKVLQLTNNKEPSVFDENYKETVANTSATYMIDMLHSTATFRSDYPLTDIDADKLVHIDEKHPEEHDDQPPTLLGDMTKMNKVE